MSVLAVARSLMAQLSLHQKRLRALWDDVRVANALHVDSKQSHGAAELPLPSVRFILCEGGMSVLQSSDCVG